MLRVCSFHLYAWACEHESVTEQASLVRSGWVPENYPRSWPSPERPGLLPPGTAPFTPRVEREIAKRKQKMRLDLANATYLHYPRSEVESVLKFWKVSLD